MQYQWFTKESYRKSLILYDFHGIYQAAEKKFAKLSARQVEIEKRFESLNLRINQMRSRQFGSHTVDELTNLNM